MTRLVTGSAAALLVAGMLLAFREPLLAMIAQWNANPMYSYGFFVPLISGYLLWSRQDRFVEQPVSPARLWGGALIAASLAALSLGRLNAIQIVEQISFVSAVAGVVLFLFGWSYLKLSAPAIAYLLFMVPVWDAMTEPLHWPFQLNSAKLGVSMLHAIGVPAYRENSVISLPNIVIEVARECSGVNYLVAVLALALPMSFLRLRTSWRRFVLIGASLAVAALANSLRVALIGTLAYYEVGSPLHGPFHVLHGLFVAAIGFVVIFVGLRYLEEPGAATTNGSPLAPAVIERLVAPGWKLRDAFGLVTLFWVLALIGVAPEAREVNLTRSLESLPLQLGRWTAVPPSTAGHSPALANVLAAWSGADGKLERLYRADSGLMVRVEVYYFAVQRQGREIVSYATADLHRDASPVQVDEGPDQSFVANAVSWPDRNEAGLFWYDAGRPVAGQIATKLTTTWRALVSGRTNGAAIMLRTSSHPQAFEELQEFAGVLRPALGSLFGSGDSR